MQLKSLLKTNALIIIALLAVSFSGFAQAPNLLNYQGVARNVVGNPLPNQTMKLRLSIHDLSPSGTVVYTEIRSISTNLGGLFSVQIGSAGASSATGTIAGVNWLVGDKYLQVELDPASNNNYIDIGTVQLVSVPYAFGAGSAATVKTNANLTGVVTSVGNATSIANGAITSDMIASVNKSKVGLDLVNNTSDASKPISTLTQAALDLKANSTDVNNLSTALGNKLNKADSTLGYVTPTQLAAKTFDQTPINNAIAGKLAIADSTLGYITPTQLAAKKFDTTSLSNRINAKANSSDVATLTTALGAKLNIADTARLLQKLDTASLSNRINAKANTIDVNIALALKAPLASPTFTGTVTTGIINTGAVSSTSVTAPTYASVPKTLSYTGSTIDWDPAQGLNAAITLSQNSTLSFTAAPPVGSYGTIVLTQDGTGSRTITLPTIASVTNKVLGSTSTSTVALSTTANSKDILNFYYDGTNCYWNIGQGYGDAASASNSGPTNLASAVTGILPVANGGTGSSVQNFVDLSTAQTIGGAKTFSNDLNVNGINIGRGNSSRGNNNANGYAALGSNTTGNYNNAFGFQALTANTTGQENSALGEYVLPKNTTGNFNTAMGTAAQRDNTTGDGNTGFGYHALLANTSGSNNTAIGNSADVASGSLTNATAIGNGAIVSASNTIQLGNTSVSNVKTSGALTAPIYASTPQALTDGSTITWNPALGLNASVILGGNRTLSFTTTPPAGAYGTLVVSQDGTGNRTLTLPTTANKVLGSTSTTSIALSTAANAKDILNFYYDGTNCFWNIGQGYGTAASSSSTTNLTTSVTGTLPVANGGTGATTLTGYVKGAGTATMTASATIPVADITGTLPVANGGTGAATLTGIIKGNGTSAMIAATPGTDYQAPLTLTTTGTGAATLSGTTLNIPSVSTVRLNSDEFTATAAQTSFTFTTTSSNTGVVQTPTSKPYMYINGTRIKNSAYTWTSGTTVTYIPASNNSYALVVGDRIQFDYAY